jgi:hypothetical protein
VTHHCIALCHVVIEQMTRPYTATGSGSTRRPSTARRRNGSMSGSTRFTETASTAATEWQQLLLQSLARLEVRSTQSLAIGELLGCLQCATSQQAVTFATAVTKLKPPCSIATRGCALRLLEQYCWDAHSRNNFSIDVSSDVSQPALPSWGVSTVDYILCRIMDTDASSLRDLLCRALSACVLSSAVQLSALLKQLTSLLRHPRVDVRTSAAVCLAVCVSPLQPPLTVRLTTAAVSEGSTVSGTSVRSADDARAVLQRALQPQHSHLVRDTLLLPTTGDVLVQCVEFSAAIATHTALSTAVTAAKLPSSWTVEPFDVRTYEQILTAAERYTVCMAVDSETLLAMAIEGIDAGRGGKSGAVTARAPLITAVTNMATCALTSAQSSSAAAVTASQQLRDTLITGLPLLLSQLMSVMTSSQAQLHQQLPHVTEVGQQGSWRDRAAAADCVRALALLVPVSAELGSELRLWRDAVSSALRTAKSDAVIAVREAATTALIALERTTSSSSTDAAVATATAAAHDTAHVTATALSNSNGDSARSSSARNPRVSIARLKLAAKAAAAAAAAATAGAASGDSNVLDSIVQQDKFSDAVACYSRRGSAALSADSTATDSKIVLHNDAAVALIQEPALATAAVLTNNSNSSIEHNSDKHDAQSTVSAVEAVPTVAADVLLTVEPPSGRRTSIAMKERRVSQLPPAVAAAAALDTAQTTNLATNGSDAMLQPTLDAIAKAVDSVNTSVDSIRGSSNGSNDGVFKVALAKQAATRLKLRQQQKQQQLQQQSEALRHSIVPTADTELTEHASDMLLTEQMAAVVPIALTEQMQHDSVNSGDTATLAVAAAPVSQPAKASNGLRNAAIAQSAAMKLAAWHHAVHTPVLVTSTVTPAVSGDIDPATTATAAAAIEAAPVDTPPVVLDAVVTDSGVIAVPHAVQGRNGLRNAAIAQSAALKLAARHHAARIPVTSAVATAVTIDTEPAATDVTTAYTTEAAQVDASPAMLDAVVTDSSVTAVQQAVEGSDGLRNAAIAQNAAIKLAAKYHALHRPLVTGTTASTHSIDTDRTTLDTTDTAENDVLPVALADSIPDTVPTANSEGAAVPNDVSSTNSSSVAPAVAVSNGLRAITAAKHAAARFKARTAQSHAVPVTAALALVADESVELAVAAVPRAVLDETVQQPLIASSSSDDATAAAALAAVPEVLPAESVATAKKQTGMHNAAVARAAAAKLKAQQQARQSTAATTPAATAEQQLLQQAVSVPPVADDTKTLTAQSGVGENAVTDDVTDSGTSPTVTDTLTETSSIVGSVDATVVADTNDTMTAQQQQPTATSADSSIVTAGTRSDIMYKVAASKLAASKLKQRYACKSSDQQLAASVVTPPLTPAADTTATDSISVDIEPLQTAVAEAVTVNTEMPKDVTDGPLSPAAEEGADDDSLILLLEQQQQQHQQQDNTAINNSVFSSSEHANGSSTELNTATGYVDDNAVNAPVQDSKTAQAVPDEAAAIPVEAAVVTPTSISDTSATTTAAAPNAVGDSSAVPKRASVSADSLLLDDLLNSASNRVGSEESAPPAMEQSIPTAKRAAVKKKLLAVTKPVALDTQAVIKSDIVPNTATVPDAAAVDQHNILSSSDGVSSDKASTEGGTARKKSIATAPAAPTTIKAMPTTAVTTDGNVIGTAAGDVSANTISPGSTVVVPIAPDTGISSSSISKPDGSSDVVSADNTQDDPLLAARTGGDEGVQLLEVPNLFKQKIAQRSQKLAANKAAAAAAATTAAAAAKSDMPSVPTTTSAAAVPAAATDVAPTAIVSDTVKPLNQTVPARRKSSAHTTNAPAHTTPTTMPVNSKTKAEAVTPAVVTTADVTAATEPQARGVPLEAVRMLKQLTDQSQALLNSVASLEARLAGIEKGKAQLQPLQAEQLQRRSSVQQQQQQHQPQQQPQQQQQPVYAPVNAIDSMYERSPVRPHTHHSAVALDEGHHSSNRRGDSARHHRHRSHDQQHSSSGNNGTSTSKRHHRSHHKTQSTPHDMNAALRSDYANSAATVAPTAATAVWQNVLKQLKSGGAEAAFKCVLATGTEQDVLRLMAVTSVHVLIQPHTTSNTAVSSGAVHTYGCLGMATRASLLQCVARMIDSGSYIDHVLPWVYYLVQNSGVTSLPRHVRLELGESLHNLSAAHSEQGVLAARLEPYIMYGLHATA